MLHQPVQSEDKGTDFALNYRIRTGVFLFLVYALIYGIFVLINLALPNVMEAIVLFGMNLAVTYGLGLILLAFIMALVYNHLCARMEKTLNHSNSEPKEG
ncbi:MAG: hypothetical protein MUO42_07110 [Anaerolineaceae bacterium]|nr:hypothetical protein [Anaerolineaceae bacterium]